MIFLGWPVYAWLRQGLPISKLTLFVNNWVVRLRYNFDETHTISKFTAFIKKWVGEETLFELILKHMDELKTRWGWLFNTTLTFDELKLS